MIQIDAIYTRQSVDRPDSISVESQAEICRREVVDNEFQIYTDKGYSGKNTDRPAVQELLEMVQAGKINVDVECNPEQGEYVAKVIQMLEQGEPVEKEYVVEERIFTHRNVSRYMENRTY